MKTSHSHSAPKGFSLVEILVVISVIGIISALSVPSVSSFVDSAEKAKVARNAQNLVSTYSAGLAVGYNFAEGETEVANVVQRIVAGANVEMSPGDEVYIGVPNLEAAEQIAVQSSLLLVGERLFFQEP